MSNDELIRKNAERLQELHLPIRRLVPDFDTQEELDDYLTSNAAILASLNAYEQAYSRGYLARPAQSEDGNS